MSNFKIPVAFLLAVILLATFTFPVFAQEYNPGVVTGQYVKYGNFVGVGPGFESFNDYDWLKLEVVSVSGKEVTLLSTGQFKNGVPIPGNGTTAVWNVDAGTEDGSPSTQGPIIAANLVQGDAIPPPNTYAVNKTEDRTYLGVSRIVNILEVTISTPDYDTELTYVYDKFSGILLESTSATTQKPELITSEYSYSIIETNIIGSETISPLSEQILLVIIAATVVAVLVIIAILVLRGRTKKT